MLSPANLLSYLTKVNGWLRDDEALTLYRLASSVSGRGCIVEIGSWQGKSTICLALGAKLHSQAKVYAIDPHTGSLEHRQKFGRVNTFARFLANIKRAALTKLVTPLVTTSHSAKTKIKEPIEFLFIDGDHSYKAVLQDFRDYSPKLLNDGLIAFHDTVSWPGPRRVVTRHLYFGNHYKNIHLTGSLTYATKVEHLSLLDRLRNYYTYFLRLLRSLFVNLPLPSGLHQLSKNLFQKLQ